MEKEYPCAQCKMRPKYDKDPKSLIARFWHWHTRFCPGWKAYTASLSEEEREELRERYNLTRR